MLNKKLYSINEKAQKLKLNYKITFKALPHKSVETLPASIRKELEQLYNLTRTSPKRVITHLTELIEKYPKVPVFNNYLTMAYQAIGQEEKVEILIEEAYHKYPDYLFAKTNYAIQCLKKQTFDEIPIIFNKKYKLKQIYPNREVFHVTEFVSFTAVIALYHIAIRDYDIAEENYELLRQLQPYHYLTRTVRRQLYPGFFQKFWRKIDKYLQKLEAQLEEKLKSRAAKKTDVEKIIEQAQTNKPSNYTKKF
ncbi:MAG: hypothetical protein KAH84_05245 [Thiomargarita sp.]|nr:hypothetical protein [Thiomargarita sp.]